TSTYTLTSCCSASKIYTFSHHNHSPIYSHNFAKMKLSIFWVAMFASACVAFNLPPEIPGDTPPTMRPAADNCLHIGANGLRQCSDGPSR
ncbi:hypothetical protein PoMZ_05143, partial [Pyricularia oryzae]